MQIIGLGTDIVEVSRIEEALQNEAFKNKYLTENEQKNLEERKATAETYAGRFAAKEAVVKALGTGFGKVAARDIEILNNDLGKPVVSLLNGNEANLKIELSISHIKSVATATAIALKED